MQEKKPLNPAAGLNTRPCRLASPAAPGWIEVDLPGWWLLNRHSVRLELAGSWPKLQTAATLHWLPSKIQQYVFVPEPAGPGGNSLAGKLPFFENEK